MINFNSNKYPNNIISLNDALYDNDTINNL